jgi:thiamine-monophosphate kinase
MGERERALLERIRARAVRAGRSGVRIGIGDDAAVLAVGRGEELVVTTDLSLEDVHFRRAWHPPEAVGHKCLARGLSDVAAMGGRPVALFLSLAVPAGLTRGAKQTGASWPQGLSWVDRFYDGLLGLADEWGVPLGGGDLAQSAGGKDARVAADIVVLGAVKRGRALLRSGGQAGDLLYVTGTLGGAAAELRELQQSPARFRNVTEDRMRDRAAHPHFFPQPRVATGRALAGRGLASAAIDVSDGLSVDLQHLCEESGLRAEVNAALLPLAAGATLKDALHGGDDYELLFTAAAAARVPTRIAGIPVHRIGRMLGRRAGRPQMILMQDGRKSELRAEGWEHF